MAARGIDQADRAVHAAQCDMPAVAAELPGTHQAGLRQVQLPARLQARHVVQRNARGIARAQPCCSVRRRQPEVRRKCRGAGMSWPYGSPSIDFVELPRVGPAPRLVRAVTHQREPHGIVVNDIRLPLRQALRPHDAAVACIHGDHVRATRRWHHRCFDHRNQQESSICRVAQAGIRCAEVAARSQERSILGGDGPGFAQGRQVVLAYPPRQTPPVIHRGDCEVPAIRRNRKRCPAFAIRQRGEADQPRRVGEDGADAFAFDPGLVGTASRFHFSEIGDQRTQAVEAIALGERGLCGLRPRRPQAFTRGVRAGLGAPPLCRRGNQTDHQCGHRAASCRRELRFAPRPAQDLLWRIQRSCLHRPPFDEARQIIGQCARTRIAFGRIAVEAAQHDRLQVERQRRLPATRRAHLALQDQVHRVPRRFGAEWRTSGQQFVKDRTQAPDVGGRGELVRAYLRLLGRHVRRRAGDFVVVHGQRIFEPPRKAEIGHVRDARLVQQHVRGLQVEVQHPKAVRVVDGLGDGAHQRGRRARREFRAVPQP